VGKCFADYIEQKESVYYFLIGCANENQTQTHYIQESLNSPGFQNHDLRSAYLSPGSLGHTSLLHSRFFGGHATLLPHRKRYVTVAKETRNVLNSDSP